MALWDAAMWKSGLTLDLLKSSHDPPYFGLPESTFRIEIFYINFYHPTNSEG